MAFCLRFVNNSRPNFNTKLSGRLTTQEIEAHIRLVILAQSESFAEDILSLRKETFKSSKLQALAPFLDQHGILRVGGRLKNSNLGYDSRHPILLKHKLSKLILVYNHKKLLHPGPQLLLAAVRQTYWITSGMRAAKAVTKECIQCFKFNPKPVSPFMAHLPKQRITETNPFNITGIDYAGPFTLKDKKGRGSKLIKGYVCLFVCFVSKAIHLELVTDLSSETFIAALRTFCSRRGKSAQIFSDNGTNFVGAQRELRFFHDLLRENEHVIQNYCTSENIVWHFIPPNTPHFGGLWESAVKSVKHHLLRVITNVNLKYEEFLTILVQVEGTVNSRPLYPMSNDPNDMQPLTPAHFLIGKPLIALPDPSLHELPINRLSCFQFLQQFKQSFWKHWSQQYLNTLQRRNKWYKHDHNVKEGTMVLIKQDNLPSCYWLLGRILTVHPGDDDIIRVVTVKTPKGIIRRGVTKICPLPSPEKSDVLVRIKNGQFSVSESVSS